jgi:hypothetical protein
MFVEWMKMKTKTKTKTKAEERTKLATSFVVDSHAKR